MLRNITLDFRPNFQLPFQFLEAKRAVLFEAFFDFVKVLFPRGGEADFGVESASESDGGDVKKPELSHDVLRRNAKGFLKISTSLVIGAR